MKKYLDALNTSNWKQVENFYHVNSVMIEKGKSCMFGNQGKDNHSSIDFPLMKLVNFSDSGQFQRNGSRFWKVRSSGDKHFKHFKIYPNNFQISNSRYEGVGDFVNIHTDFSFVTEKVKFNRFSNLM